MASASAPNQSINDGDRHKEYISTNQNQLVFAQFNELRQRKYLIDATLVVGRSRRQIDAHRIVLAAASGYFRSMFRSAMDESQQNQIEMLNIDEDALSALIDFIYTSHIVINQDNVQSLLTAARYLQMIEIEEVCCDFLKQQLDVSNCLEISIFADKHSFIELKRIADEYAKEHFEDIIKSDKFCRLLTTPQQLIDLISSDELHVRSEGRVFNAAMAWIRHDVEKRRLFLSMILKHVRLHLCSQKFLRDIVSKDATVKNDNECLKLVVEAMNYRLAPHQRSSPTQYPNSRKYGQVLYAIGGDTANVERMNRRTGVWQYVTRMSTKRRGVAVAVHNDQLYAISGNTGRVYLNSIERFDPYTNRWINDIAPMNTARAYARAAVLDGVIYVVGGSGGVDNFHSTAEKQRNKWIEIAPMSARRSGVSVTVLNGYLYAIGGYDGTSALNTVERYDPTANQWCTVASMGTRRSYSACTVYNGYVYVAGGNDGSMLSSVERYDPMTNMWMNDVAAMNNCRWGVRLYSRIDNYFSATSKLGLAVVNGRLYAIGGDSETTELTTVEAYDREMNSWSIHDGKMNKGHCYRAVGVIQQSIDDDDESTQ